VVRALAWSRGVALFAEVRAELNPIERVWWHLREEITRNHTGATMEELIDLTLHWFQTETFPDRRIGL